MGGLEGGTILVTKQESTGAQLAGYNCRVAGCKHGWEVCEGNKELQPEHERGVKGCKEFKRKLPSPQQQPA